jgi:hypothetical protein
MVKIFLERYHDKKGKGVGIDYFLIIKRSLGRSYMLFIAMCLEFILGTKRLAAFFAFELACR